MTNEKPKGKTNGYKNTVLHAKRSLKWAEARERQKIRNERTTEDQLKLVKTRRGESKRETRRLTELLKIS